MKKLLYILTMLAAAGLYTTSAHAQTVNYSIRYNDPYQLRKFKLHLDMLTMDGFNFGAGLKANYELFRWLNIDGQFRMTYFPFTSLYKNNFLSEYPTGYPTYGEAGVTLHFFDKLRENRGKVKVTLASGYYTEKYIILPTNKRRVFALHGGLMQYNMPVVRNSDTYFVGSDDKKYQPTADKYYGTQSQTFATYVGICSKKIKKIGISIPGYGGRRAWRDNIFFADAIFGATHLSDMTVGGSKIDVNNTPKSNIGFRLGAQWNQNGAITRIEGGSRPQVQGGGTYFLFTFGICLIGNEKAPKTPKPDGTPSGGDASGGN